MPPPDRAPTMSLSFSCSLAMLRERRILRAFGDADDQADVLGRKEALRNDHEQSSPVTVTVAMNTSSVRNRKRSATSSVAR